MASFLILYGSGHGQTAKVAEYMRDVLDERGHEVSMRHVVNTTDVRLEAFDAVVIGSPVNNGEHLPDVVEFVGSNRDVLATRTTAFFQLSLAFMFPFTAADNVEREWVEAFIERTGWQPDQVGFFDGAVAYTRYDRPTRLAFKLVSVVTTGDTDTSRDYQYTNWDDVERFIADFARSVESSGERAEVETREKGKWNTGPEFSESPLKRLVAVTLLVLVFVSVLLGVGLWLVRRRFR